MSGERFQRIPLRCSKCGYEFYAMHNNVGTFNMVMDSLRTILRAGCPVCPAKGYMLEMRCSEVEPSDRHSDAIRIKSDAIAGV